MRIAEFNKKQLRNWQVFHLLLEEAGWDDPFNTEDLMRSGALASPEGHFLHYNRDFSIEISLYLPGQLINLEIRDRGGNRGQVLHIFYKNNLDEILEWIVDNRSRLSLENLTKLVQPLVNFSDLTLLELGEHHILPLEKKN